MSDRKSSVTAAVVASTLLLLRDDPELGALASPESTDAVEAAVRKTLPVMGHLLDHTPWPLLKRAAYLAERLVSPGFVAHYAIRKHAVRQALRRAVDEGAKQVVLVGAGFDMLSSAVPESVPVFEVDHPATQQDRRDALGKSPARNVAFVAVDLALGRLREALLAVPSFDPNVETVYVAEGLVMYLEKAQVDALLDDVGGGSAASTLIVTVVTPDDDGRVRLHSQRKVVDWCMRWLDEPFVWGEPRGPLATTLERHGFGVESMVSTMDLRDDLLAPRARKRLPRATGEVIVVARKITC